MVSSLGFQSGRCFQPGLCRCFVSLDKKLCLSSPGYMKMGAGDHNARCRPCSGRAFNPGGSSNISSRFILQTPELSANLMGHLARKQTLPTS